MEDYDPKPFVDSTPVDRFHAIIERSPDGVYQVDYEGHILYANSALASMLGFDSTEEILSLNSAREFYVDPEDRRRELEKWPSTDTLQFRTRWKRKDGALIFVELKWRKSQLSTPEKPIFDVFVQDLTERLRLEGELHHAQKMESVGRLAGGVAHDFNNILMTIGSYVELLPRAVENPEKFGRFLEQIQTAVAKGAAVTRQLLAFSRKQVLAPTTVDLRTLITDFASLLRSVLGDDIQLQISAGDDVRPIYADPGQLEQALMNLAVNARDAMPNGGRFTIRVQNAHYGQLNPEQHKTVNIPKRDYVLIEIADSGAGMDTNVQEHLFEPFFTTKEVGKGTGLGLSTTYGIIKQMEGFIWVDSHEGEGTRFEIFLPVRETPEPVKAATQDESPVASKTVLVVEDEESLRAAIVETLGAAGFNVLEAGTAVEALEVWKSFSNQIDVLLTDMVMPTLNGFDLATRCMESSNRSVPVIFMSGYHDRTLADSPFPGRHAYLSKPFNMAALVSNLRELLRGNAD